MILSCMWPQVYLKQNKYRKENTENYIGIQCPLSMIAVIGSELISEGKHNLFCQ